MYLKNHYRKRPTFTTGSFPFSLSNSSCSSLTRSSRFFSSSPLLHSLCSLRRSRCESCSARCCKDNSSCCTRLRRFSFSCNSKYGKLRVIVSPKATLAPQWWVLTLFLQVSPWWAWCWTGRGWLTAAAGGPVSGLGFVSGSHSLLWDTEPASPSPWPPAGQKHYFSQLKINFLQCEKFIHILYKNDLSSSCNFSGVQFGKSMRFFFSPHCVGMHCGSF